MRLVDRAKEALQTVPNVDFSKYLHREEAAKVIPAEDLAEEGKRRMLLGSEPEPGLTLPWEKANNRVLIRPGKLALWVGWTHHGKSQMVKQIMLHGISAGEKVCIASMEEEITDVWCDMGRMATGTQEPSLQLTNKWIAFCQKNLWFYDQQGNVESEKIRAVIRYCAEELKVTQFVVDSLMMLSVPRDDYDAQSRFVGDLKILAKDTGCTIHLVAHMRKRDGKGGEESPGHIHDIAGAHDLGSKADYVFNVWRDKQKKEQYECVLVVEKQRGRVNWLGKLGLHYHGDSRQFVEGVEPICFWRSEREVEEMPF